MKKYPPIVQGHGELGHWEPSVWKPKVGDRVRVRLSGECSVKWDSPAHYADGGMDGHPQEWNGEHGTIDSIDGRGASQGHPYGIRFDRLLHATGMPRGFNGMDCAALELEPLEPTP